MESGHPFGEFSIEMADFELKKVKKFDRLWRIEQGGSMDQAPLVHEGRVYFGSYNHNFYCVDAATGSLVWKFKARDRIGISSPVEWNGIVYFGSYDYNLYALDAATGSLVWKFPTMGEVLSTPGLRNGVVYFGSRDHNFYAVNASTGELLWKFRTMDETISDFTFHGEKMICTSYDRNYYCLDADTGRLIWKLKADYEVINTGQYAVQDGYVYLSSMDNMLRKVEIATGRQSWKKKFGQYGINCGTHLFNGKLLLPSRDGNLYAVDLEGNMLWKFSTMQHPIGAPLLHRDRIYLTCEDHNLYCLGPDGKVLWKFRTHAMNWWKPAAWGDLVFFSSYDCFFYAVKYDTGSLAWKFRTEGSPSPISPPYEDFELNMVIPEKETVEGTRKSYETGFKPAEESGSGFYKSRITYQISSQYAAKGKYRAEGDGF